MKSWILAAGLLSIVPLSELMLWASPPQPVVLHIHENKGYTAKERRAVTELLDRLEREKNAAKALAVVYDINAENIESYKKWKLK